MLRSSLRRILVGLLLIPAGLAGTLLPLFRAADKVSSTPISALFLVPALLAIPLGVLLVVLGTLDGYRELRSAGWREHPAATALVACGVLLSFGGLLALVGNPEGVRLALTSRRRLTNRCS